MGRKPIYPRDNCLGCNNIVLNKKTGIEFCTLTFKPIEPKKIKRCEHYNPIIDKNSWRKVKNK